MSEREKAVWKRLIPQLHEQNTVAKIDGWQLKRYCEITVLYEDAREFLTNNGTSYCTETKGGGIRHFSYPEVDDARKYHTQLCQMEARFAMTPADRLSIGIAIGEVQKAEKRAAREEGNILEVGI